MTIGSAAQPLVVLDLPREREAVHVGHLTVGDHDVEALVVGAACRSAAMRGLARR